MRRQHFFICASLSAWAERCVYRPADSGERDEFGCRVSLDPCCLAPRQSKRLRRPSLREQLPSPLPCVALPSRPRPQPKPRGEKRERDREREGCTLMLQGGRTTWRAILFPSEFVSRPPPPSQHICTSARSSHMYFNARSNSSAPCGYCARSDCVVWLSFAAISRFSSRVPGVSKHLSLTSHPRPP